mmetsp:Transcript_1414/g.4492  ORF Transcript_1414/g.4492 Transcript_1414/m.4492 type:complete len:203 (-) Transcript_1414:922-1530(-)
MRWQAWRICTCAVGRGAQRRRQGRGGAQQRGEAHKPLVAVAARDLPRDPAAGKKPRGMLQVQALQRGGGGAGSGAGAGNRQCRVQAGLDDLLEPARLRREVAAVVLAVHEGTYLVQRQPALCAYLQEPRGHLHQPQAVAVYAQAPGQQPSILRPVEHPDVLQFLLVKRLVGLRPRHPGEVIAEDLKPVRHRQTVVDGHKLVS